MKLAIANLFTRPNRRKIPLEVEEELQFHIAMLERKYTQRGVSSSEAKTAALKRFGNVERVKKQCVQISERNTLLRRVLKTSSILIGLAGLSIQILSTNFKIARIGGVLIMIAISGRLLLYVRGLGPGTFLPRTKQTSLSIVTDNPEDGARTPQTKAKAACS